MLNLTNEDLTRRWDEIPQSLREELCSEVNADFIRKTCETEHLPEEKIYDIMGVAAFVHLGFLHPGDFAEEIAERLQINRQTADLIAKAINERIFAPIKKELDDIYEPPSRFGPPIPEPPRLIEEIKTMPAPQPLKPPVSGPTGEFARFGVTKESVISSPRESASSPRQSASMEPPPKMLREETATKSSPATSSFKLETPTPKLSDIKTSGPMAQKPAIIDFGGSTQFTAGVPTQPTVERKTPVPPPASPVRPSLDSFQRGGRGEPIPPSFVVSKVEPPVVSKVEPPKSRAEEIYSAEKIPVAKIGEPITDKPVDKGGPPRIVHYSGLRTPLAAEKPRAGTDYEQNNLNKPPMPTAMAEDKSSTTQEIQRESAPAQRTSVPMGEFAKLTETKKAGETTPPPPAPPRPRIEPPAVSKIEPPEIK